jgi:hypothetical protein
MQDPATFDAAARAAPPEPEEQLGPVFVPIVLAMDEANQTPLLDEWLARQPVRLCWHDQSIVVCRLRMPLCACGISSKDLAQKGCIVWPDDMLCYAHRRCLATVAMQRHCHECACCRTTSAHIRWLPCSCVGQGQPGSTCLPSIQRNSAPGCVRC